MTSTLMHDAHDTFGVFHRHGELHTAAVRQITQLALSFDHRLVDGELGSQVLVEVGRLLHDPAEAFVYV